MSKLDHDEYLTKQKNLKIFSIFPFSSLDFLKET